MPDAEELRRFAAGLAEAQKQVDSKHFYDQRGSELFDEITTLPEYYPTRTELALLERRASALVERIGARDSSRRPRANCGRSFRSSA